MVRVVILWLVQCTGWAPPVPEAPPPVPEAAPPLSAEATAHMGVNEALVPSPAETARLVRESGLDTELATLVGPPAFDLDRDEPDLVAVRTGVVLADLLLTVRTAPERALVSRLDAVATGLSQLDVPAPLVARVRSIRTLVSAGGLSREELIVALDEAAAEVVPQLNAPARRDVVPLVQAGSWLEGAHLISRALRASDAPAAGEAVLRVPEVVNYFIAYVAVEAEGRASRRVRGQLLDALTALKAVAEGEGPPTEAELAVVQAQTARILEML